MSFLYATPITSTVLPRAARPCSLRRSTTRPTQYSGMAALISPASSMKRVR